MGFKEPKKGFSVRLSNDTMEQIKLICEYDKLSQAELIEIAINSLYVKKYYNEMPDKFPASKKSWLVM